MSGFGLPGGPLPAGPWHTQIPAPTRPVVPAQYNGAAPNLPASWGDFTGAQVARPTAEQLQGGHEMVAPPMGRGMATGATAAAPPAGYGAPQSAGGGGAYGGTGAQVYGDAPTYARTYMAAHGYDPYAHTAATDTMYKLLSRALPAIFDLAGQGGMALDQLADPSQLLNSIFFAGPGSAYGKMADFGRQGFEGMKGALGAMTPDEQAQMITASSGLQSAGLNPFMQGAVRGSLEKQLGGYQDYIMANRGQPGPSSTKLWDYLVNAGLDPFSYLGR